jgi:hypothetical protein
MVVVFRLEHEYLHGRGIVTASQATRYGAHAGDRSATDLPALLGPLYAATEALARFDARAAAVRDGLIARLAFAEAAVLARPRACLGASRLGDKRRASPRSRG